MRYVPSKMLDWKLSPKKDAETKLQFTSNEWDLTFQPFLEAAFMWQKKNTYNKSHPNDGW
jgi:hypothetical protein